MQTGRFSHPLRKQRQLQTNQKTKASPENYHSILKSKMASHHEQSYRAGESRGCAEEKTGRVAGSMKEKAREVKEKTCETAQQAKEKTCETAQQAKEKTAQKAQAACEKTGETTGRSATQRAEEGKENTMGVLQQTGVKVKQMAESATETVKQTLGMGTGPGDDHHQDDGIYTRKNQTENPAGYNKETKY